MELDEIMLDRWEKCLNGDFQNINKLNEPTELDTYVWALVYDKYIEKYSLGEQFELYFKQQKIVVNLRLAFVKTRQDTIKTDIKVAEVELEKLDPTKQKGMTIDETLIWLSEQMKMGGIIKKSEISVVQYRALLDRYGKD